jgi:hypothetical protein
VRSGFLVRVLLGLVLLVGGAGICMGQERPAETTPKVSEKEALEKAYAAAKQAVIKADADVSWTEGKLSEVERILAPLRAQAARLSAAFGPASKEAKDAQEAYRQKTDELKVGDLMIQHDRALNERPRARREVVRSGWALVHKYVQLVDSMLEKIDPEARGSMKQVNEYVELSSGILDLISKYEGVPRVLPPTPKGLDEGVHDPAKLDEQVSYLESSAGQLDKDVTSLSAELASQRQAELRLKRLSENAEKAVADRAKEMLEREVKPRISLLETERNDALARMRSDRAEADRLRQVRDKLLNGPDVAPTGTDQSHRK